jgi:ATP-dependent exoDNAse (exonuclease V) alpha subunit
MTVNAAQGQEWDTVIFCATDCGRNPFLTDSTIPQGNATLNTAISRAKSCLILVLDCNFWHQRPRQLLSRLMLQAT